MKGIVIGEMREMDENGKLWIDIVKTNKENKINEKSDK